MQNASLKTFTNSSLHGRSNTEMDKILDEFKEECQPVLDKFINKCVRNNIEYCSINGALYDELSGMILSARLQARLDLDASQFLREQH